MGKQEKAEKKRGIWRFLIHLIFCRWYLLTCTVPYSILEAIGSLYFSSHIIINHEFDGPVYKISRFVIAASAQLVRASLFILVIERIISTIFLENYSKFSSNLTTFFVMTFVTYFTTVLHMGPDFLCKTSFPVNLHISMFRFSGLFVPDLRYIYFNVVYVEFGIHVFIIFISKILHIVNKEMYGSLAYRVSLKRRYQVIT